MSLTKILATATLVLSLAFAAAAQAGSYYNPTTGETVTVVENGDCVPGQKEDAKVCVCKHGWGNRYKDCRMALVAKTPVQSGLTWAQCMAQTEVTFQACQAGALNGYLNDGYGNYYQGGGYVSPVYNCDRSGRGCGRTPQPAPVYNRYDPRY